MRLFTIGFTRKTAERFFGLLRRGGVRRVIDVRLQNESQLAGWAKKNDLPWLLRELAGIDYEHLRMLSPTKDLLDRRLKSKLPWPRYEREFLALLRQRKVEREITREQLADACLLCAEDAPDECHRRLVAEYLAERLGPIEIVHLR